MEANRTLTFRHNGYAVDVDPTHPLVARAIEQQVLTEEQWVLEGVTYLRATMMVNPTMTEGEALAYINEGGSWLVLRHDEGDGVSCEVTE